MINNLKKMTLKLVIDNSEFNRVFSMCLGGGIGKCLPLQVETLEWKSVNCGEALT